MRILTFLRVLLAISFVGVGLSFSMAAPQSDKALSVRQKEHAKLFGSYKAGRRLSDVQPEKKEEIEVKYRLSPPIEEYSLKGNKTRSSFLHTVFCNSDAVVIGRVRTEAPSLTEDGQFIFTELEFEVERVIKPNLHAPFATGATITVVRAGGKKKVNGRLITAVDADFRSFEVDERYLLLLRYIPGTGSYQAFKEGSFGLFHQRTVPMASDAVGQVRSYRGPLLSGHREGGSA